MLVVDLVEGDMDHEPVGCGAMPVLLVGGEPNPVAGPDDLDWSAAALTEPIPSVTKRLCQRG